jgi:hypothetical protein
MKNKNQEEELIENLLNSKPPIRLTEVNQDSSGFEEEFCFSIKNIKIKLSTLNNEDYEKIINTLDKGYAEVEEKIQEALNTGHNEFVNPIQDNELFYDVGMRSIETIILEIKREKEYSFNQTMLKKVKPSYDNVTEEDLKISRFLSNRGDINLISENLLHKENLIKSVKRLKKEDFNTLQEKIVNSFKNKSFNEIKKTTVILESLVENRNESLSKDIMVTMSFYLNEKAKKEEIKMQNSNKRCISDKLTK